MRRDFAASPQRRRRRLARSVLALLLALAPTADSLRSFGSTPNQL